METKVCYRCKVEKTIDNFKNKKANKDGKDSTCKECQYGHPPHRHTKNSELIIEKECLTCKQILPIENFSKVGGRSKNCYQSSCKKCRYETIEKPSRIKNRFYRQRNLRTNYGLNLVDFDKMVEEQQGKCKICGTLIINDSDYHLDHDHATGKIRGVLCRYCNSGLGFFKDNIQILQSAILYLQESIKK